MVDHNLRRLPAAGLTTSTFDRASIMLYRFPALFYRSNPSACAPMGNGQDLSEGDRQGLQYLYPYEVAAVTTIRHRRVDAFEMLIKRDAVGETLKDSLDQQLRKMISR